MAIWFLGWQTDQCVNFKAYRKINSIDSGTFFKESPNKFYLPYFLFFNFIIFDERLHQNDSRKIRQPRNQHTEKKREPKWLFLESKFENRLSFVFGGKKLYLWKELQRELSYGQPDGSPKRAILVLFFFSVQLLTMAL